MLLFFVLSFPTPHCGNPLPIGKTLYPPFLLHDCQNDDILLCGGTILKFLQSHGGLISQAFPVQLVIFPTPPPSLEVSACVLPASFSWGSGDLVQRAFSCFFTPPPLSNKPTFQHPICLCSFRVRAFSGVFSRSSCFERLFWCAHPPF